MKKLTPLLVLTAFIPLAINIVAVLFLLPETVPLHAGFSGVDSYGSKYSTLVVGILLTATCLLFAMFFHNIEKLNTLGLVHGPGGTRTARIILVCSNVVLIILSVIALCFWMS